VTYHRDSSASHLGAARSAPPKCKNMTRGLVALLLVGLSLAACGAVTAPKSNNRATRVPGAAASTAAFGRYLHHRYGPVRGHWICPTAQAFPITGYRGCLAEVKAGRKWHHLSAGARFSGPRVVISVGAVTTWVRRWWPYSRHFIRVGPKPWAPGTISVNSPAYDWWFLARCAHGQKRKCIAFDGLAQGFFRFYSFTCVGRHGLIVCTNRIGDVMRYRQHG
jgi:hypothetical protein